MTMPGSEDQQKKKTGEHGIGARRRDGEKIGLF